MRVLGLGSPGARHAERQGMGEQGAGRVRSGYLQKGGQHGQAPWAPQGLVNFGKCGAEVNHVDLQRRGGWEWASWPAPRAAPPLRGEPRPHLGRETLAADRVLRAGPRRGAPVQVELQGPELPPGTQRHVQPGRQRQLHCGARAGREVPVPGLGGSLAPQRPGTVPILAPAPPQEPAASSLRPRPGPASPVWPLLRRRSCGSGGSPKPRSCTGRRAGPKTVSSGRMSTGDWKRPAQAGDSWGQGGSPAG